VESVLFALKSLNKFTAVSETVQEAIMIQKPLKKLACLFLGVCIGCSQQPVGGPSKAKPAAGSMQQLAAEASATKESSAETSSAQTAVELTECNWSELQALIAEKKGKIVVVDVWSTACEPCMKEFPHLVELQKQYPNDVVGISFDIDFAGMKNKPVNYYRERVLKFLGSQAQSSLIHRMCTTPADELFTEIKLDSIPAVYVYGREGNLAKRFEGSTDGGDGVSYQKQVVPLVEELVK
jgi:thiol-disulfide isomerase/thioredoxin